VLIAEALTDGATKYNAPTTIVTKSSILIKVFILVLRKYYNISLLVSFLYQ